MGLPKALLIHSSAPQPHIRFGTQGGIVDKEVMPVIKTGSREEETVNIL